MTRVDAAARSLRHVIDLVEYDELAWALSMNNTLEEKLVERTETYFYTS